MSHHIAQELLDAGFYPEPTSDNTRYYNCSIAWIKKKWRAPAFIHDIGTTHQHIGLWVLYPQGSLLQLQGPLGKPLQKVFRWVYEQKQA